MIPRRDFITLLGGAAATWPMAARAQQAAMPVIGFLTTEPVDSLGNRLLAFHEGLRDGGFIEGQNLSVEYRSGNGRRDGLPALAADLVRRSVKVIVAVGASDPARAAKTASSTIPIVFAAGGDPVFTGLVSSLNRPGGNITGVTLLSNELQAKRLELMRDMLRNAKSAAYLQNPANLYSDVDARNMQAAATQLGFHVSFVNASTAQEIDVAFATMAGRTDGLLVQPDPFFSSRREQIIAMAAHHALPAIYASSEYPKSGGLVSYSANLHDAFRQVGLYTARILKGDRPADLPVQQPTKFVLAINLRTARTLGLSIAREFLLRADEVIE